MPVLTCMRAEDCLTDHYRSLVLSIYNEDCKKADIAIAEHKKN